MFSTSPMIVTVEKLRRSALGRLASVLREKLLTADPDAPPREPPEMLRERTDREIATWIRGLVLTADPSWGALWDAVDEAVTRLLQARDVNTVRQTLEGVFRKLNVSKTELEPDTRGYFDAIDSGTEVTLEFLKEKALAGPLEVEVNREIEDLQFLAKVMQMCDLHRGAGIKHYTSADETALQQAYAILDRFGRLPAAYSFLRTDELRPFQTYLSFADPGEGHLAVTVRDSEMLEGLVVHIEHIDREDVLDPKIIEAYRMPPIRTAARVRLHTGLATPCTAFIGRPVFEGGDYAKGRLKAVHTLAGACSAMFALGIAECKVAMDRLTASEAVDFMQVVAGNVHRDRERQRLSAAFNINTPLLDDRKPHTTRIEIREPEKIALLAVHLAAAGHFDKVTWDGASEGPSRPILGGQLTSEQVLHLVHRAHERGLETYISAGMLPEHMFVAALVGVGGVGIGLKLHALDPKTNRPGPIDPGLVKRALKYRDEGAGTLMGEAARELARLDWDYARGLLNDAVDDLRNKLYDALRGWHTAARPADKPGSLKPEGADHILLPLTRSLQDLVDRIAADYPRRAALPEAVKSRGTDVTPASPGPLEVSADRAGQTTGDPQIKEALASGDGDRLRRLLAGLALKQNA